MIPTRYQGHRNFAAHQPHLVAFGEDVCTSLRRAGHGEPRPLPKIAAASPLLHPDLFAEPESLSPSRDMDP